LIGIRSRVEVSCVEFSINYSSNCVKMKKIWDCHLSYAMGEPYIEIKWIISRSMPYHLILVPIHSTKLSRFNKNDGFFINFADGQLKFKIKIWKIFQLPKT